MRKTQTPSDTDENPKFASNLAFLYFNVFTYNSLNWFKHQMLKNTSFENMGLSEFVNRLIKIPAYVIARSRQLELRFPAEHPMIKKLTAAAPTQFLTAG
jgi:hypothetical protein